MTRLGSLWWAPALAGAVLFAAGDTHGDVGDVIFFAHAGETLFGPAWADVYADPTLQSGPIQLAVLGALAWLAELFGISLGTMLAYAIEVGGTIAFLYVLRRVVARPRERPELLLLAVSLAAVVLGLPQAAYVDGHPAQLFVPLLWVLAGLSARDGRVGWGGVLVGLSAGLELWGILGVCVLAVAPSIRAAVRGAAVAAGVTALLFAPFVVHSDFAMLGYRWEVASGTLLSLVVDPGTSYPWSVRLVQGATAVLAGGAVAWSLRAHRSAVWAAPLAAVLVRFLFDPVFYASYLVAPLALALLGAAEFLTGDLVRSARSARGATGQGAVPIRR